MNDTLWYKNAIFYELYVRAFSDSYAMGMAICAESSRNWITCKRWG